MDTVRFNKSGGPITVTITSGYAQPGSYSIVLTDPTSNNSLLEKENNFSSNTNSIKLLEPVSNNDKKQLSITFALILSPPSDYNLKVDLEQDGNIIGNFTKNGTSSTNPVILDFEITLEGNE